MRCVYTNAREENDEMPKNPPARRRKPPVRSRPFPIRVMASAAEKKTLEKAAKKAGRPMTRMVLESALERALALLNERMAALKKKAKRDEEEG
jgi:uncharacterized protein (DUF1778 family)